MRRPNPLRQLFPAQGKLGAPLPWPNKSADRGYTIFITGRCGSTELVSALTQSAICGAPDEYFNEEFIPQHNAKWNCDQVSSYVVNLIKNRSPGRVFGFKIDAFRHQQLADLADPMLFFPKPAFRYVYMNRRNVLEQAYSYAHAKQTGVWHRTQGAAEESEASVEFSDASLWHELSYILAQESYFERYFVKNSLSVLRIDYEMFCTSKAMVVAEVMLAAGCELAKVETAVKGLRESYRRMKYDAAKPARLIAFRHKYRRPLATLEARRGRLPLRVVRNYVRAKTGIDLLDQGQ